MPALQWIEVINVEKTVANHIEIPAIDRRMRVIFDGKVATCTTLWSAESRSVVSEQDVFFGDEVFANFRSEHRD